MAKRRYYPQEKANTCGVAAIRTMLAVQFDVRLTEKVLEAFGTEAHDPISKNGSSTTNLRWMLKGANKAFNTGKPWTLRTGRAGTIEILKELTKERPVMVRVYYPQTEEYHFLVVLAVTKYRLRVFDPAPECGLMSLTYPAFLDTWTDPSDGETWYATLGGGSK